MNGGRFFMKLIAKTQKGTEYLHSKQNAFFAPDSSANKICKVMNDVKFRLHNDTEIWHVYDYDITQDLYVTGRLTIYSRQVKLKSLQANKRNLLFLFYLSLIYNKILAIIKEILK